MRGIKGLGSGSSRELEGGKWVGIEREATGSGDRHGLWVLSELREQESLRCWASGVLER